MSESKSGEPSAERSVGHRSPADVLIVGGGVIGLATALEVLATGRSVRVIERHMVGDGASHGNGGLITPSHAIPLTRPGMVKKVLGSLLDASSPISINPRSCLDLLGWGLRFATRCRLSAMRRTMEARTALLHMSCALYQEMLRSEEIRCEWQEAGLILLFTSERAMEQEARYHALLKDVGIEVASLTRDEVREREPLVGAGVFGGASYPQDAHLRPETLIEELARLVEENGGIIEPWCEVTGFISARGEISGVRSTRGDRLAGDIVLAMGAWSPLLAKQLGLAIPIKPGRGYSITFDSSMPSPKAPLILDESAIAVTPWKSGLRLAGTMEFCHLGAPVRAQRLAALRRGAARFLEIDAEAEAVEHWYGWRPMTPDEVPIIGRTPRARNVFVAAGHGMMGLSMAPATAKLVTAMISGDEAPIDPAPYCPTRFH